MRSLEMFPHYLIKKNNKKKKIIQEDALAVAKWAVYTCVVSGTGLLNDLSVLNREIFQINSKWQINNRGNASRVDHPARHSRPNCGVRAGTRLRHRSHYSDFSFSQMLCEFFLPDFSPPSLIVLFPSRVVLDHKLHLLTFAYSLQSHDVCTCLSCLLRWERGPSHKKKKKKEKRFSLCRLRGRYN